nr:DUF4767 domain-containing protein [Xylocopilactobacillus apis]
MSTSYKRSSASSADTKSKQFNPVINPKNVSSPGSTSLWSKEKDQELSNFMNSWQSTKKDTFVGTYDGAKPDHFGTIFPDVLVNHGSDGTFAWGNKVISMKWSPVAIKKLNIKLLQLLRLLKESRLTYLRCIMGSR